MTYHADAELGPESLLWQYAGDSRIAFMGATIGILQLMHPAVGAGVMEHSNFFDDPMDRVARRSEEHTSELQSLMRISYAVFCLKKNKSRSNQNESQVV